MATQVAHQAGTLSNALELLETEIKQIRRIMGIADSIQTDLPSPTGSFSATLDHCVARIQTAASELSTVSECAEHLQTIMGAFDEYRAEGPTEQLVRTRGMASP